MVKKTEAKDLKGMEDILDEVEKEADTQVKTEETTMEKTEQVAESVAPDTPVDMQTEIDALFEGVEFPEDFKTKTQTIFESTVKTKVDEIVAERLPALVEEKQKELADTMAEHIDTLYTRLDNFMDAIVEQWYGENEVAIRSTVRADLAESFLSGLKGLFESNYVNLPEDKVDLFEEKTSENEKLKEMLDQTMKSLSEKNDLIGLLQKREFINEHVDGMTDLDAAKFKTLAENVEFVDEATFRGKLTTIKDTFFKDTLKEGTNEDTVALELVVEEKRLIPTDEIDAVASAMGRFKL